MEAVADNTFIGKLPGSYKWKGKISQKKPFKSLTLFRSCLNKKEKRRKIKGFFMLLVQEQEKHFWVDLENSGKKFVHLRKVGLVI